jgi:predicted transcriptional regulator/DNA-binding XRE family transcriptional regulator
MLKKKTVLRFILGLKIRQLRIRRELSLKELADNADMSVSYLNEIEKGKKYPKIEKLAALAQGLQIDLGELVSFKTGRNLHPLLKFLESDMVDKVPLELFGLSESDVVDLMGHDPDKFASFVLTVLQITRSFDMKMEDIYSAALRSFIEANENYFSDIEKLAKKMKSEWSLSSEDKAYEEIKNLLIKKYGYEIDTTALTKNDLLKEDKFLVKRGKINKIFLNAGLSESQQTFYLACELGHIVLGNSHERGVSLALTLQDFKTRYFADALLLDEKVFTKDLKNFFAQSKFDPEMFLSLISKYKVSEDVLFHRLTQMLPAQFKVNDLFFLEVQQEDESKNRYSIINELHLLKLHSPHGVRMNENYCQRWVAIKSIKQLKENEESSLLAQISVVDDGQEYFSLSIARLSGTSGKKESLTIGFAINKDLKNVMKFLDDKKLARISIGQTCERCSKLDCEERLVPPVYHDLTRGKEQRELAIAELIN